MVGQQRNQGRQPALVWFGITEGAGGQDVSKLLSAKVAGLCVPILDVARRDATVTQGGDNVGRQEVKLRLLLDNP